MVEGKSGSKRLVICGPTASGKSELSDSITEIASSGCGSSRSPRTILFDSMQVYRELPVISNQHRRLPAELAGIVSVTDEWSAAHHREAAGKIISEGQDGPETSLILEAGTGMYLNAFLLDIEMAPRVSPEIRLEAERRVGTDSEFYSFDEPNRRRAVRAEELRLSGFSADGEDRRGSIWDGSLNTETAFIYLRPERSTLDPRIAMRSSAIVSNGLEEATYIKGLSTSTTPVSRTVLDSIGVRELIEVSEGDKTPEEAAERISIRTRQLARRQIKWFDKLLNEIHQDPKLKVTHILTEIPDSNINTMSALDDIIGWWMD